ncbi:bifunctional adenosylcobinamide kinase/adenosylcobinamide-phosphate guanylyltransferase [Sphingosinicella sp. BN140058]|uniref:bifunctional adenosylcobinamide kinase/adenosylcobinamide-phosphate guanylyltransferase n=1 Tax=Sphingosinicella sp. BN140058 TaxID=1892855 RepID=UPI0010124D7E|nr:bifunctional adenosylcobinamide kinase/adenosylcobinamide-phosphate guanylyltransferase [Sphingosinicella sp. BN140058]QAY77513.1 bifunctional adenosylcobinamide kinase/adenosylcobinamide-phosphate guanylyltransferase [Sphingosinicella sp. BN140058]
MSHPLLFVLGGARSGKSRYALERAEARGLEPVFIATAQAFDAEMRERIALHQAERSGAWTSIEAPLALTGAIERTASPHRIVLVDCLTLWVSNLMLAGQDSATAFVGLVSALDKRAGPVILVSDEVGLGIVPDNKLARDFRDLAGTLNQRVAAVADEVQFVAAGLPLRMK